MLAGGGGLLGMEVTLDPGDSLPKRVSIILGPLVAGGRVTTRGSACR